MLKSILVLFLTAVPALLFAQDEDAPALELPECDIFLFDMQESDEGIAISNGQNATNRAGYDNQPWFTPDSKSFLFSANRKPDRTDIFEYFAETGETRQVTDTPTQEYSPQSSPDNRSISFVTDGETANQSIWFTARENDKEEWLLGNQGEREPVGYYSWNRETGFILYWSRYGHSLKLVHQKDELSHYVTGDAPPSTPHIIPGTDKFSFLHRQGNGQVWIKELDPSTLAVRPLTSAVGSNPNYCWTPGGRILMVDANKLYRWSAETTDGWQLVDELKNHGITGATRVASSPNGSMLAIVGLPDED